MKLGLWLVAMVEPLIAKILVSLGFSIVTITGLTAIVNDMKAQAIQGLGLLSADTLSMFVLSGGATALGMIFGACATKLMLWQIQNATKILGAAPT